MGGAKKRRSGEGIEKGRIRRQHGEINSRRKIRQSASPDLHIILTVSATPSYRLYSIAVLPIIFPNPLPCLPQ